MEEASYFNFIPPIAMMATTPIYCILTDSIGRKYTLLTIGVLHAISWILTAVAESIWVFYVARILYGASDACIFSTLPTYIAEVSTPKVRGLYGNVMLVSIFLGQFLANVIGFYFSITTSALIMLPVPLLFLITFIFMPETPYYLLKSNNLDAARRSLQRLRRIDNVENELKQLQSDVERQLSEPSDFKSLFSITSNRKGVMIANLSRIVQQLSGFGFLVVYSQYIFQEAGGVISNGVASMIVAGILAFVNFFSNLISNMIGRKRSMIISSFGCGLAMLSLAVYFYLQIYEVVDLSVINWFPVAGLVIYTSVFCVGLGVVPTLMLGEMFSTSIRKHATAVSNIVFGMCVCFMTKVFQLIMSAYGLWLPFFMFSIFCFIGCIVCYFIVPETKGKTLEEIQQMLKGNIS